MSIPDYIHEVGFIGWLGFVTAFAVMVGGWVLAFHARWRKLISFWQMAVGIVLVSTLSAVMAFFITLGAWGIPTGLVVGAAMAALVVYQARRSLIANEARAPSPKPVDVWLFRGGIVAVISGYVGTWTTFANRGYPPLAPYAWHAGILLGFAVIVLWAVGGLHLMLRRMLDGTMARWESAFRIAMAVSGTPAMLGLAATLFTGNRWVGFLAMPFSLVVLWVELRRLVDAFPTAQPSD